MGLPTAILLFGVLAVSTTCGGMSILGQSVGDLGMKKGPVTSKCCVGGVSKTLPPQVSGVRKDLSLTSGCKCDKPSIVMSDITPAELHNHITSVSLRLDRPAKSPITVSLYSSNEAIAFPITTNITFPAGRRGLAPITVFIYTRGLGETFIHVNASTQRSGDDNASTQRSGDENTSTQRSGDVNTSTQRVGEELAEDWYRAKVIVVHSLKMRELNVVIGWIYFVIWSISFYPQLFSNFMNKSVIGLNFDFLAYNITGFIFYSIYNAGLYWSHTLQDQYFEKYGGSVIPVPANDVFFAIHAAFTQLLTICQCFVYQSANQTVSLPAKVLVALMWAFGGCMLIPVAVSSVTWITYITSISYIKLAVTLIKYVPQAYMNYTRKSTQGWAIGFVHCDIVGGVLSVLQVFLLAYNNDQWSAIFGNFTKFGLAVVSIVFDVLFLVQHYVLYNEKVQHATMTKSNTTDIIMMHDHMQNVSDK